MLIIIMIKCIICWMLCGTSSCIPKKAKEKNRTEKKIIAFFVMTEFMLFFKLLIHAL